MIVESLTFRSAFPRRPLGCGGCLGVLVIEVLQHPLLALGQCLRLPRRRVVRLSGKDALCFLDHLVQHPAHFVHHLGHRAALLAVLFGQGALVLYPAPKGFLAAKHPAHRVRRDLLARLRIAQLLPGFLVPLDVALHQLVHALKAALLGHIAQRCVLQLPAARFVPGVVLVYALVQNGPEGVSVSPCAKVYLAQRRVHIAPGILFKLLAHCHGRVARRGVQIKQRPVLLRYKRARFILRLPGFRLVRKAGRAVPRRLDAVYLPLIVDHL